MSRRFPTAAHPGPQPQSAAASWQRDQPRSNADSPSTTWPALAATLGGVELINLGFGGSALLDPFTARVMRDTPADLISVKIGINLVNMDLTDQHKIGQWKHYKRDDTRLQQLGACLSVNL